MRRFAIPILLFLIFVASAACSTAAETSGVELPSPTAGSPQADAAATEELVEMTPATFAVGDARFTAYTLPVEAAIVAAADLDGDGHTDLVGAGEPQITLFRGDGQGGLAALRRVPGGEEPNDFALMDLDGDGDTDIAIANHDTDYLTILLGDGEGDFQPAQNSPLKIDVRPHPHTVRGADLDADGFVDLIVDHREGEGLLVLRGQGEGRFEMPGKLIEVGGDPYLGMALGDLNGDGYLDLVTPNPTEVGVFLNAGGGRLRFISADRVPADTPFAVGLGDFNGDGDLDLVTGSGESSPQVEVFLGDGQGGFTQAPGSPYRLAKGGKNIIIGDLNGDGLADAVVASWGSPEVLVLLGDAGPLRTAFLPGGEHPWGLAAVDLNEDGVDDLVIGDGAAPEAVVYVSGAE